MKELVLASGGVSLLNDEDYERLCRFKWWRTAKGYAFRPRLKHEKQNGSVYLHREIMGEPLGMVDHINGDKLDNRRENLRVVNNSQNLHNAGPSRANRSGYRGVSFSKYHSAWDAAIKVGGVEYNLGRFPDKRDAGRMRALAEIWFAKRTRKVGSPHE